jgi:hypothetical protein
MWHIILALMLAFCGVLATPATSTFAQCSGFGCDNKDAVSEGCSSTAYTVKLQNVGNGLGVLNLYESSACGARYSQMIMNTQASYLYSALESGTPSNYYVIGARSCNNCTSRSSLMAGGLSVRGYGIYRIGTQPAYAVRTAWYP